MVEVLIGLIVGAFIVWLILRKESFKGGDQGILLLQEQLGKVVETLDKKLGESNETMRTQISESNKLIRDITHQITKVNETNKHVVDVTNQLKTIQNVLLNPKQRGVLGEFFLETVLNNTLPPEHYSMQYKFENGDIADAVIYFGLDDEQTMLPVDSKFPLENYNRLVGEQVKSERGRLEKAFIRDVKGRIIETSKYIRPKENTLGFAFMFIPSEAIFYDLLANSIGSINESSRDLIEFAFEKKVLIVSPTSFMAYLQTVMQGFKALKIEASAKEIMIRVEQLGKHLTNYDTFMEKLGNSMNTTVNHYNKAYKELNKVDKDVLRITGKPVGIEPLLVSKPARDD